MPATAHRKTRRRAVTLMPLWQEYEAADPEGYSITPGVNDVIEASGLMTGKICCCLIKPCSEHFKK